MFSIKTPELVIHVFLEVFVVKNTKTGLVPILFYTVGTKRCLFSKQYVNMTGRSATSTSPLRGACVHQDQSLQLPVRLVAFAVGPDLDRLKVTQPHLGPEHEVTHGAGPKVLK